MKPFRTKLALEGLDCADCAAKLERTVQQLEGVIEARLNFGAALMDVQHEIPVETVISAISAAGYGAQVAGRNNADAQKKSWLNNRNAPTLGAGVFLLLGYILQYGFASEYSTVFYILTIILGGYKMTVLGLRALKDLTLDMNFLMILAVVGAGFLNEWSEGATVLFLFAVGNLMQAYTIDKTRQSIKELMSFWPNEAVVRRDGKEIVLALDDIKLDDILPIKPGQAIPMDGVVLRGLTAVNEASITGESMPVTKVTGDKVFAGSLNESGFIEVKVTKLVGDTTLAKIIELVEEAQGQKAPSQNFVDVFSRYYTPLVVLAAILVTVIPTVFLGGDFHAWFYKALVLLAVSCPCALVISTPVAIVAGIGRGAKAGVLFKGGAHLEQLGSIGTLAFDKTGTLTEGKPVLTEIRAYGCSEEQVLLVAASLEAQSEHPLAQAVLAYAKQQGIEPLEVKSFKAVTGRGVTGIIDNNVYYIGNLAYLQEVGIELEVTDESDSTCLLVADSKNLLGTICVADRIRSESRGLIQELKQLGLRRVTMLTGDQARVASRVAAELGMDEYKAQLLPDQKLQAIRAWQEQSKVAMVGDGVNDAPALAMADIGIAMGGAGTDTALEVADIVLMQDDLTKLPWAVQLSRRALGIIKQNIWFSILIKGAFLVLTFMDVANLWMAVFADSGTAVLVTLNAMRLLRVKES